MRTGLPTATVLFVVALLGMTALVANWAATIGTTDTAAPAATAMAQGRGWNLWDVGEDATPVRWDPCTTVTWMVRPSDPAWLSPVVQQVLEPVEAATGLRFRQVAATSDRIGADRNLTTDDATWAPVVVTFTTPAETSWLTDADRAVTIPVVVTDQFVTGQVLLHADKPLSADLASRDGSWGGALLHEFGHLVGLDHVDDPAQVMHPTAQPGPVAFGAGDHDGLAALAADPACLPAPPARDARLPQPGRR